MNAPGPLVRYGRSDYGPYFYGYLTYATSRFGVHTAPIGSPVVPKHAITEVIRVDMIDPVTLAYDEAQMLLSWFRRVARGFTVAVPNSAFDGAIGALTSALKRSEALARQSVFLLESNPPPVAIDPAGVIDVASSEADR